MRKILRNMVSVLLATTCVVGNFALTASNVRADEIEISVSFGNDSNFVKYIKQNFDTDGNRYLSEEEAKAVTEINIENDDQIKTLSYLDRFPNLKKINVRNSTSINKINANGLKSLEYIDAEGSTLKYLEIDECENLTYLNLRDSKIYDYDISDCPNIKYFDISGAYQFTVNIMHEPALYELYKNYPAEKTGTYKSYDMLGHGNKSGESFFGYNSNMKIVTECPEGYIDIVGDIKDWGVRKELIRNEDKNGDILLSPSEVERITAYSNSEYPIHNYEDLTLFPNLKSMSIWRTNDLPLIKGVLPNLTYIGFFDIDDLTSIDLTGFPDLENVHIKMCYNLNSINISNNPKLKALEMGALYDGITSLSSLDISKNPELMHLVIPKTNIKEIDISKNPKLIELYEGIQSGTITNPKPDLPGCYTDSDSPLELPLSERALYVAPGAKINTGKPAPTPKPTKAPAATSTPKPTTAPGAKPTVKPTAVPSKTPTAAPSTPATPADNGVGGFIDRLYTVALGRDFDEGGKNYWTNEIKVNGQTGADIARQFLYSEEFLGKNMSQDDFLTILYRTFFDREPDAGGLKYWKDQMSAGQTKEWVIAGFINSEEWANICLSFGIRSGSSVAPTITIVPNENVIGFATRLYTTCLKREFDPEGLDFWAKELANLRRTGSEAAKGFFFSDEISKSGISDSEFLTRLYKTLMNREPEKDGFDYWLSQMKSGAMSRESVFDGFAASEEWVGICADYGILR